MPSLYKSLESLRTKTESDLAKAKATLTSTTPGTDAHTVARIAGEAETAKLRSIERSFDSILLEAGVGEIFQQYVNGLLTLKEAADAVAAKLAKLNS